MNDQQHLLDSLNEQQREAVIKTEGPLLILAGAGTGKTKTLTTRVAHIIHQGLATSSEIMCVTFTNKAAQEMATRIYDLLGSDCNMPWLGTFHSLGAKFLRKHYSLVDLKANFNIIDTKDLLQILKAITNEFLDKHSIVIDKIIYSYIENWKNNLWLPADVSDTEYNKLANSINMELPSAYIGIKDVKSIYSKYQKTLLRSNYCDFSDLILLPTKALQKNADLLSHYHKNIKYILVDEYQDVNLAQYLFIRILAQKGKGIPNNICCVGDDDQAIYGWRGANVKYILQFEKDFKNANIIRLERNYRSTLPIINVANHIISHNVNRLGKNLYPDQVVHPLKNISIKKYGSSSAEVADVCHNINMLALNNNLSKIAIIVRLRVQIKEFEKELINLQIPYHIIGDISFYERKEIKDIIAYLRVISRHSDNLAFERVINTPKRGIGNSSIDKIKHYAKENHLDLYTAGKEIINLNGIPKKASSALSALYKLLDTYRESLHHLGLWQLTKFIYEESGYKDFLKKTYPAEEDREENIKYLENYMKGYLASNLPEYLEKITLNAEKQNNTTNAVNLLTIHASKGLEFETVFSPGWEDGIMPHKRMQDDIDPDNGTEDTEEERRLAYVLVTRAKENLYISWCSYRNMYGKDIFQKISPFIETIPEEFVTSNYKYNPSKPKAKRIAYKHNFNINDRVYNTKLGWGNIISIDGDQLTIKFNDYDTRTVMAPFVKTGP